MPMWRMASLVVILLGAICAAAAASSAASPVHHAAHAAHGGNHSEHGHGHGAARELHVPKPASKPAAHAASHPANHSGAAHRELRPRGAHKERAPAAAAAPAPPPTSLAHLLVAVLEFAALLACLALPAADGGPACARAAIALAAIFAVEAAMHVVAPAAHVSVGLMVMVAVVFTINPVEEATAGVPLTLHMGTVPPLCAAWLGACLLYTSPSPRDS